MSTTALVRPEVPPTPDARAAAGYLARYRGHTRDLYTINLRQWFEWCERQGITPLTASRAHIEVYARWLEEKQGRKLSTVANKLGTIAGFYRFAYIDKIITDNPAEYLRRPSVPRLSTTKSLTRQEALRCLDLAQASSPQDHALWCLLILNGPRIGEAIALDIDHLGRANGYRTIRVAREKGNREGDISLSPRTSHAIDLHVGTRVSGPLFRMRPDGHRMDRRGAARIVDRIVKEAGVTGKRITPHSLRHTHITMALNAGASVRNIVNSMGYTDARQVSYYDRDRDSLARNDTHLTTAFIEG